MVLIIIIIIIIVVFCAANELFGYVAAVLSTRRTPEGRLSSLLCTRAVGFVSAPIVAEIVWSRVECEVIE